MHPLPISWVAHRPKRPRGHWTDTRYGQCRTAEGAEAQGLQKQDGWDLSSCGETITSLLRGDNRMGLHSPGFSVCVGGGVSP